MTFVLGIDEAGRGACIGPLVICGVLIERARINDLLVLHVKDSKLLTPKRREALAESIKAVVNAYKIARIEPGSIDAALKSSILNLNKLEALHMASIINVLEPDAVFIDSPSANPREFTEYLLVHLSHECELHVEHKADMNYPIVAAASIIAKVARDFEIKKIQHRIGYDFGSGYPSDPKTQKFLKKHWGKFPSIFRKEWATYQKVFKAEGNQKNLTEF